MHLQHLSCLALKTSPKRGRFSGPWAGISRCLCAAPWPCPNAGQRDSVQSVLCSQFYKHISCHLTSPRHRAHPRLFCGSPQPLPPWPPCPAAADRALPIGKSHGGSTLHHEALGRPCPTASEPAAKGFCGWLGRNFYN